MKNPFKIFKLLWPGWYISQIKKRFQQPNRALMEEEILEHQAEEDQDEFKEPRIYPSRNLVLITTEPDLYLRPCKILSDHKIEFKGLDNKKKEGTINPEKPLAHNLILPLQQLWPTKIGKLFAPRYQRYRVYTIQAEGEMTHDPHDDKIDDEDKVKLESVLKLAAASAKASIAERIMAGLKGKKTWEEFIPYIIIGLIVFMFLLAFQIVPNLPS